jgi:hypothetical protein
VRKKSKSSNVCGLCGSYQGGNLKKGIVLLATAAWVIFAFSQAFAEKEVSLHGTIFAEWFTDLSDTLDNGGVPTNDDFDSYNNFGITRAYLTGKAKLSERTYGKITVDVIQGFNVIRLENAYLKWRFYSGEQFGLATKFGLHETPWLAGMHKVVRRYVARTWSQRGLVDPDNPVNMLSDYGISFIGWFGEKGKWGDAHFSIFNGAGTGEFEDANPKKDLSFVVWLTPLNANPDFAESKIGFQYYTGYHNEYDVQDDPNEDMYKHTVFSAMGNVQFRKLFNLGVEYNSHSSDLWYGDNNSASALTLFGSLWLADLAPNSEVLKTLAVFFRYGMVDDDKDDLDDERSYSDMIFGVECAPVKGFAASVNYRAETEKDVPGEEDYTASALTLNAMLKF